MLVKISWKEPEEGYTKFEVLLSDQEVQDVAAWSRNDAAAEWGITIPKIRTVSGESDVLFDARTFAEAIRYNTGEGVYKTDCPVFVKHGITRS
jgi:hypothetical protein